MFCGWEFHNFDAEIYNFDAEISNQKVFILRILSKFNLSLKELNSLTYPVYLNINL